MRDYRNRFIFSAFNYILFSMMLTNFLPAQEPARQRLRHNDRR
jgi:hypothetical protein